MIRHTPPSRERGTVRRLAALAIATFAVAFGLTGCQELSSLYLGPFTGGVATPAPSVAESGHFVDCSGPVGGQVEYSAGQASVVLTNGPADSVALDSFDNGMYVPEERATVCGEDTQASWRSDDGTWSLFVGAFPPDGLSATEVDVSISYQLGDDVYGADATCPAQVPEADASGMSGVADCKNLTWVSDPGRTPAPSSAFTRSFDAKITFEAKP